MRAFAKTRRVPGVEALLKGVFAVLIAFVLANIALGFASLPTFYERVSTSEVGVIVGPDGETLVSDAMFAEAARERGMSISVYAAYYVVLNIGNTLVLGTLAALVLWRARRGWFGWFTACVILFLGAFSLSEATWVGSSLPFWVVDSGLLLWTLYLLYFFLFPNGRAAPRRARPVAGVFFALQVSLQLTYFANVISPRLFPRRVEDALTAATIVVAFAFFVFILVCQVYRYRHVSNFIERQQTKWFLLGMGFVLATWPVAIVRDFPFEAEFFLVTIAILPVNIAVATMRHRLFDVDTFINRALVYGALTISLVGTYLSSVILLQYALRSITNEDSQLAVVVSTLAIAALFNPLRRRIQRLVDRRFYRQKYDARLTLESFSAKLRDETDLEHLTDDLLSVVRETMRPEHAGLWLREAMRKEVPK